MSMACDGDVIDAILPLRPDITGHTYVTQHVSYVSESIARCNQAMFECVYLSGTLYRFWI
jgi:hypothetical protein